MKLNKELLNSGEEGMNKPHKKEINMLQLIIDAKKEIFDEIEKPHLYKIVDKTQSQDYIITIGQKRWEELKRKHLSKSISEGKKE